MSNIPKLRFPEFKGEWEEKIIQDFAECCAGATPDTKKDEYWIDGTIPWMSSGEVNNTFIYSTEKKITQLGYDKTSTKLLPSNTVVIALAGQGKTRGTVPAGAYGGGNRKGDRAAQRGRDLCSGCHFRSGLPLRAGVSGKRRLGLRHGPGPGRTEHR